MNLESRLKLLKGALLLIGVLIAGVVIALLMPKLSALQSRAGHAAAASG